MITSSVYIHLHFDIYIKWKFFTNLIIKKCTDYDNAHQGCIWMNLKHNVSFFNPSCQKFVYIRDENKINKMVEEWDNQCIDEKNMDSWIWMKN
jgi:hypothetical protein